MTKEHTQVALLRAAAADVDARFFCEMFDTAQSIKFVLTYPEYNWKLCTPPRPDVVHYMPMYKDIGLSAYWFKRQSLDWKYDGFYIGVLKRTINGETGKVTAEVIEL